MSLVAPGNRPAVPGSTLGKPGVAGARKPPSDPKTGRPSGAPGRKPRANSKLRRIADFLPRPVRWVLQGSLALVIVGMLSMAVLYLLVMRGPISIGFLVRPFEEAINRELRTGGRVAIENAVIRQSEDGRGIEFRLANLRIMDASGAVLAETPFAGISLSGAAILRGRIAPVSVEFIRPTLRLSTTPEGGLALAVSRPRTGGDAPKSAQLDRKSTSGSTPNETGETRGEPTSPSKPIDIIASLQNAIVEFRQGDAASSYLRELAVRDATLSIEHGGQQAVWSVPGFSIDVQHFQKRSIIAGEGLIGSPAGQWGLSFRTTEHNKGKRLRLEVEIAELVPRSIAENLAFLPALSALEMPVAGTAKLDMSSEGGIVGADVQLTLAPGRLHLPVALGGPVQVTNGALHLTYSAAERRIVVHPSELVWNESRAIWSGTIDTAAENQAWRFDLASANATLNGVALDKIDVGGSIVPDSRLTRIDRLAVSTQGTKLELSGGTVVTDAGPSFQLTGTVGPMTLPVLTRLWPKPFLPNTAKWIRENVKAGRMAGGTVKLAPPPVLPKTAPQSTISQREAEMLAGIALDVELQDLEFTTVDGNLPVAADAARLRIENDRLELTSQQARFPLPSGKQLPIKDPRLVMAPLSSPETWADVFLQTAAPAGLLSELVDQEPFAVLRNAGVDPNGVEGRGDTSLKIGFPAVPGVKFADLKLEGRIRLTEVRAKGLLGGLDLSNGNLLLGLTEKALDAKGEMLVAGVPVKLAWQRIFGAVADKQPAVRLTATLDGADRDALGLSVNHMVFGEVPVVLAVQPDAHGQAAVHIEANLSAAELVLDTMAWRKPPGRPAVLHSDIVRTKDGRTELTGFKIVGEDLSLDGNVTLDAKNQLRAFNFPAFAVNVLTKLEMSGRVRDDGVLEVKAKGTAYDGRAFFRSLFAAGQIADRALPVPKNRPGLDLAVEIDTLIGFNDTNLKGVHFNLKRRSDKIVAMQASGMLSETGVPVAAEIRIQANQRLLLANSADAGSALRLVGFYPNMRSGIGNLEVNLDGKGYAEKTGRLRATQFAILGDPVVSEVLQAPEKVGKGPRKVVREQIDFDRLDFPFSVGHGQVVLGDSTINGPLLGARLNGKIDYNKQTVFVEGTYVPLYGLNSIPNSIPIIGDILSGGRSGEGLFGITFQIQGPMGRPQVQVNPLSMLTPGLLRQIWETAPQGQVLEPRAEPKPGAVTSHSSSAPPQTGDKPAKNGAASSSAPQRVPPAKGTSAGSAQPNPPARREPVSTAPVRSDGQ